MPLRSTFEHAFCGLFGLLLSFLASVSAASAEEAQPLNALAQMPVKEISVFKDGHAFVLHEGTMPLDSEGNVTMDYLPAPVLGTFWPYSASKSAKLSSVIASQHKVLVPRSALHIQEFIRANPGAQVEIVEIKNPGSREESISSYEAQILEIPQRSSQELESTAPPNSGQKLPVYGDCVLLKTQAGTSALPLNRIAYIRFKGNYQSKVQDEELRNLLSLKLDWGKERRAEKADVGMIYLQKGIRWIPQYKVSIDGNGNATVKLQASLVNDLVDLKDVTVHLVVGVPSFSFKDDIDPISLQKTLAAVSNQLAQHNFRNLSNAIMSQTTAYNNRMDNEAAADAGAQPELAGSEKNEDLYVFTLKHISLRKGQCMVVPVCESELKYKNIYTLTLPFSPPADVIRSFNHSQQSELERLIHAPRFVHKIRLNNKSEFPLTTAPALILKNDRVIAQGMMTYTASGATSDLALTTAVDLKIKKQDKETLRTPNAVSWQGDQYGRVDLSGSISVSNYGKQPADIEVVRYVLGKTGKADHNGEAEMVNVFEDYEFLPDGKSIYPVWWSWYSWPSWWSRFNGVGKISWKDSIKANETLDLNYSWSYFWR